MKNDEIVYAIITMQDILSALSKRLGEKEAMSLSAEDLQMAREEVRTAIDHNLDVRDLIDMGLDSWAIVRKL